jgi:hypothetical protein
MPQFVIEHQYLVPMYQDIVVGAYTLEMACAMAVTDDIDWDTQEMVSDNARATTISEAKMILASYAADPLWHARIAGGHPSIHPLDMVSLATFLHADEAKTGPRLAIPATSN